MKHRRVNYRRARLGVLARFVVAAVLLVGVLFVAVFPTRTVIEQRDAIGRVEDRLDVLRSENDRMVERVRSLSTPSEIERIAREEYNLARPGEEVFVIVPSETKTVRMRDEP